MPKVKKERAIRLVHIRLPIITLKLVDELIKAGVYDNRSELIRTAVKKLVREEMRAKKFVKLLPDMEIASVGVENNDLST